MSPTLFRVAPPRSAGGQVARTLLQCAGVWGLTLVIGPWMLLRFEQALALPTFAFAAQRPIAITVFLACSALNLTVGFLLAVRGEGTPLPLECPRKLVVAGPYRWVRNPMAIAGLGQGASIAIWLGSWIVVAYVVAGSVFWHFVLRPAEERDLRARFGAAYMRYRDAVPLWVPRISPYIVE